MEDAKTNPFDASRKDRKLPNEAKYPLKMLEFHF